jgi:hypothetical protein
VKPNFSTLTKKKNLLLLLRIRPTFVRLAAMLDGKIKDDAEVATSAADTLAKQVPIG